MKQWYLTRQGIKGSTHRGEELKPNKYVLLSEKQAESHNKRKEVLTKTKAPQEVSECQFPEEWKIWESLRANKIDSPTSSKTRPNKDIEISQ